ncbi:hypothetical protein SCALM49S_07411 [Streptomyces californicus]
MSLSERSTPRGYAEGTSPPRNRTTTTCDRGGPPGGGPLPAPPALPDGAPLTDRHPLPHRCPHAHGRRAGHGYGRRARVQASGSGTGHRAPGTGHTGLGTGIEHDPQARARARRSTRARASAFALRISHRSRFAPTHARGRSATFPSATACTRRRPSPRRARRYRLSNATGTAWRKRAHRGHRINRPGPIRPAPSCCIGNDEVAKTCPSAQRTTVRSIDSIKSLPQPHTDEKATLGDERDATTPGTPTPHATPPTPADHTPVPPPFTPRPHNTKAPRRIRRGPGMG